MDALLLDLCWSLWTELGVAGVIRKHQHFLILIEELVLLTAILSDQDPRLRDESLDWCSKYHHFVSVNRVKTLCKKFAPYHEPISVYHSTINTLAKTSWPIYKKTSPLKVRLSGKSSLRPLESPALLNIRARSIFGIGTRADIITFFLTHSKPDYASSDMSEVCYSRINLGETLDAFYLGGLFDKFSHGNQHRYRFIKNENLQKALGPIPKYAPSWGPILEVILPLRDSILKTKNSSDTIKTVEISNVLNKLNKQLKRLNLTPPQADSDFEMFLSAFQKWLLDLLRRLSTGEFPDRNYLIANY